MHHVHFNTFLKTFTNPDTMSRAGHVSTPPGYSFYFSSQMSAWAWSLHLATDSHLTARPVLCELAGPPIAGGREKELESPQGVLAAVLPCQWPFAPLVSEHSAF
jgi:hypothetical protein